MRWHIPEETGLTGEQAPSESRPHRRIWAIAGPAILANASAPMVGLVDTWAIGHMPDPVHLAAVGAGTVIFNYLLWAFGFLRMGTTGLVAQANGQGNEPELLATLVRASALAIGCGIALVVFQRLILAASLWALSPPGQVEVLTAEYFDIRVWAAPAALFGYVVTGVLFGMARTRAILWLQLLLNGTNAALNVILVVGFDLGVAGVAWGTLVAQWLTALASLWLMLRLFGRPAIAGAMSRSTVWVLSAFRRLVAINGYIFIRTIFLMTALAWIMRVSGALGETEMAVSHVITQYTFLIALSLDGFAHATEALAGAAWGRGLRDEFRRWCMLTTVWAVLASIVYSMVFLAFGDAITALLTDITEVRALVSGLMPLIVLMPVISVWCFQFDGIFIGATAAAEMMVTMGIAFAIYLFALPPMTERWGLAGLWGAVLIFWAARGIAQAAWYPRLEARL
jgi:MATE family multidrug resistance protein